MSASTPFDLADEYERQLADGIRLSGEDRHFFIDGRIADLRTRLAGAAPRRILDFGCGLGDASRRLADAFAGADVVGVDTAAKALGTATARHAGPHVRFQQLDAWPATERFDLCYVNGVFHHVVPSHRAAVLARIHAGLLPGAHLAVFENNPWNPGARLVMRRIAFDRDAVPISPRALRALVTSGGFEVLDQRSLFYFPRVLGFLRALEPVLGRLPFGAQHWVLARRAGDH